MAIEGRPVYTAAEAFRKFEPLWRAELASVTLAGEFEVPQADAELLLRALVRRSKSDPRLLQRYPACLVVSLVSTARRVYRGGALWDGLFEVLEERRTVYRESQLGEAFLEALDELEMPNPANSVFRFVAPIALHACIPDYCVGDLLRMLAGRQESAPGLDGASFIAWATGLGGESRVGDLDRPVRDFIANGGEYAIDLVDRTLDLLHLVRRGERDLTSLIGATGVPQRFARECLRLLSSGELTVGRVRTDRDPAATPAPQLPRIALDLEHWSVVLRLPAVAEVPEGRASWQVTLDGEARRVATQPGRRGAGEMGAEMVVDKPARSLGVTLGSSVHRFDIDLVNAEEPLLAFDRSGAFLPHGTPLPNDDVWLLHTSTPDAFTVLGSGAERATAIGPVGWNGWDLTQVSLRGARGIEVRGRVRSVQRTGRARLELSPPLIGVRSAAGEPIHDARPTIDIPMTAAARDWTVEVRDGVDGSSLSADVWTLPAREDDDESEVAVVDPFDGWPAPLVGSFEVRARGPLGTRANWRVTVCEGLRVVPSVECRSFVPEGLTPMSVRLDSAAGLMRDPSELDFGGTDLSAPATVRGAQGSLSIVVEPTHLELCHISVDHRTEWVSSPLTLASDGSDGLGMLEVRMPTQKALPPLLLHTGDGMTQTLVSHRGGAFGHHRFELSRLRDTLQAHKVGELRWDFGDEATTLVRFRPTQIAQSVAIDDGQLIAEGFAEIANVVAGVYFVLAPWRQPVLVPLDSTGVGTCPPEIQCAGPLRVVLRIDDPWLPQPWEAWRGQGHSVRQTGRPEPVTEYEDDVMGYLAGERAVPHQKDSLPYLWAALEVAPHLRHNGLRSVEQDVALVLRGRPRDSLQALGQTQVSTDVALRHAIFVGLTEQVIDLPEGDARLLWQTHPALAALGASSPDTPEDVVASRGGQSATAIMSGEGDAHESCGRFTDSVRLHVLPLAAVEGMMQAAAIVPAGLLDADTRAIAAFELFLVRAHPALRGLTQYGYEAIALALKVLRAAGYPQLADAVATRAEQDIHHGWQRLPQLSLLMAALARAGSRGNPAALRALDEMRGHWVTLAGLAPRFVEMDLLLAELMVTGEDRARATARREDQDAR